MITKKVLIASVSVFALLGAYAEVASAQEKESDVFGVLDIVDAPANCISKSIDSNALTLMDLVEIAICNNPTLSQSYLSAKTQAASYGQSLSSYLPSADLSMGGSVSEAKSGGGSWSDSVSANANLSLSWLVYDFGGREASVNLAKSTLQAANFTSSQAMQDTVFDVVNAYYTLLSNQANLQVSKDNEETYLTSYNIATKKYELGLVSLGDKLNAETYYAQSQLETSRSLNKVEQSKGILANLLNISPDTPLNLAKVEMDSTSAFLSLSATELIDFALKNRADLKAAGEQIKSAEYQLEKSKTDNYPSISLSGSAGAQDSFSGHEPISYNGRVGLSLSVPLFTGFNNTYNNLQQRYKLESAKKHLDAEISAARKNVWIAYQDYNTAIKNSEIADKLFVSSDENYRVALGAYKVGKNDILTLLEAQNKLAEARKEKSTALYSLFLTKNELLRAIGKMEMI